MKKIFLFILLSIFVVSCTNTEKTDTIQKTSNSVKETKVTKKEDVKEETKEEVKLSSDEEKLINDLLN